MPENGSLIIFKGMQSTMRHIKSAYDITRKPRPFHKPR